MLRFANERLCKPSVVGDNRLSAGPLSRLFPTQPNGHSIQAKLVSQTTFSHQTPPGSNIVHMLVTALFVVFVTERNPSAYRGAMDGLQECVGASSALSINAGQGVAERRG